MPSLAAAGFNLLQELPPNGDNQRFLELHNGRQSDHTHAQKTLHSVMLVSGNVSIEHVTGTMELLEEGGACVLKRGWGGDEERGMK